MSTAGGRINPVRPLEQVFSGQPLKQSHVSSQVSPDALGRQIEKGRPKRLGEDEQHSHPCLWLCLYLEWFRLA